MELTKFSSEIELLKNNLVFNQANKLRQLKPYVDQEGNCQKDAKHQITLRKTHQISKLIIRKEHSNGHM